MVEVNFQRNRLSSMYTSNIEEPSKGTDNDYNGRSSSRSKVEEQNLSRLPNKFLLCGIT